MFPEDVAPPAPPAAPPSAPSPQPELAKQVEGGIFSTPGTDAYVGTIQRPSKVFWEAYAKEISKKLGPGMLGNIETVVSLSWYDFLTDKQKQGFLDRFKDSGTLEVPDDSFVPLRSNPKDDGASAMSGTEQSAAALSELSGFARMLDSPEITELAVRFWDAREYDADFEGMHLSVRLHDWVTRPFEKGAEKSRTRGEIHEVRATVGGMPIAELQSLWWEKSGKTEKDGSFSLEPRPERYISKPPVAFRLTIADFGYYSHSDYKSFVRHPSPVLAVAMQRILQDAPANLGRIRFAADTIGLSLPKGGESWSKSEGFPIVFRTENLPKKFIAPFWKAPIVRKGKELKEIPVEESDLERIQAKIDAKETEFNLYIDKLYKDDNELAKKLDLSPVGVAKLMGDSEYEKLLKQRDELMWSELPTEPTESS